MTLTKQEMKLANESLLDIQGLEDIPSSLMPVPWVRLVQPTSQKTQLADGSDAQVGTFFFNDTKTSYPTIRFAILKAKHGEVTYKREDETSKSLRLAILAINLETMLPFMLTLSVMSFSNFGSLIAQMKQKHITKVWEYAITATSEKQENDKGKYYVVKLELGEKLADEMISELEEKHLTLGSILDRSASTDLAEEITV